MYRFERSGRVKNGKWLEASQFAREIAEYINTKYPQGSLQVYAEFFDDIHSIHWYSDYKDLATFESLREQLLADQGYWAIVTKGMEWFLEGSFRDRLMSSV